MNHGGGGGQLGSGTRLVCGCVCVCAFRFLVAGRDYGVCKGYIRAFPLKGRY